MSRFVIAGTFKAAGQILVASIVKKDTTNARKVAQAGVGDRLFGVVQVGSDSFVPTSPQAAAVAGESVEVFAPGSTVLVQAGAGLFADGDFLTSDASGLATTAKVGDYVVAQALETAGSSGEMRECIVLAPGTVLGANSTPVQSIAGTYNATLADSGKTFLATAADVVFVLPPLATSRGFTATIVSWAAAATLQGGAVGTLVVLNAADSAAKMFGSQIATPAANKGIRNTMTTALQGDNVAVRNPDGASWLAERTNGTWVRQS